MPFFEQYRPIDQGEDEQVNMGKLPLTARAPHNGRNGLHLCRAELLNILFLVCSPHSLWEDLRQMTMCSYYS